MTQIIGVTLPEDDLCWYGVPAESWTPDEAALRAAEPVVLDCIQRSAPQIFAELADYRCQFVGLVIEGRQRIHYNFFFFNDDEFDEDWETEMVCVEDGGEDYFQVEYDLESGECVKFNINGEA